MDIINENGPVRDLYSLPNQFRLIDSRENIDPTQKNRILKRYEAIAVINDSGLDLICINKDEHIYKLLDYGKFKFDQQKKQHEINKKNRENARTLKEFQFTPGMADHDFKIRLNHVKEALLNHDVRIGVKLNFKTRNQLPRGTSLTDVIKDPEFVLNRVINILGESVITTKYQIGDKYIYINLKQN